MAVDLPDWTTASTVSTPQPWQAAKKRPANLGGALVAGSANAQLVIPGVIIGLNVQTIYLHTLDLDLSATVAGTLFWSDGNPSSGGVTFGSTAMGVGNPGPIPLAGSPLTAGNGLFIWVDTNATVRGMVAFSQE